MNLHPNAYPLNPKEKAMSSIFFIESNV